MSGRLEEIPGEEAFRLSRIGYCLFYERGGIVKLKMEKPDRLLLAEPYPAGGNFEEPVTQATLKVVGAFHGLFD